MDPLLGTKLWFGPRGWSGFGWRPVSWEGWVVTATCCLAIVAVVVRQATVGTDTGLWVLGIVLVTIAVCWLKGTSPGSSAERAEIERARAGDSADTADPPPDDGLTFDAAVQARRRFRQQRG